MRVSNFLLWQIAYAEIWVTDTLWPDFRAPPPARSHRRLPEARAPLRRHRGRRSRRLRRREPQVRSRQPSVTRVLAALVLLPAVVGIVWFLPPICAAIADRDRRACWRSTSTSRSARLGSDGLAARDRRRGDAGGLHRRAGARRCRSALVIAAGAAGRRWRRRSWRGRPDADAARLRGGDVVPAAVSRRAARR